MESNIDVLPIEPYVKEANYLIDTVINNALAIHEEFLNQQNSYDVQTNSSPTKENVQMNEQIVTSNGNDIAPNIEWLTGENFTIKAGERKIHEFLRTWKRDESWLYCIDFLGEEEHECDYRYRYRVMWSVPTRRKPIPRATASVYFTMKVSKFKPKAFPANVYYVFETSSLVHRPGQSIFQQKWLKDIIDSKIRLMNEITF